jgi:AcrR family transcriptional regulator
MAGGGSRVGGVAGLAPGERVGLAGGTKLKLLDVAEQLVAEHGFDLVSLRAVTARAGVNLAAVNYHFGTREGLFQALVERRVAPINRERLAVLDRLEAEAGDGGDLRLEDVLEAFFRPVVTIYRDSLRRREVFFRFMGRCVAESEAG